MQVIGIALGLLLIFLVCGGLSVRNAYKPWIDCGNCHVEIPRGSPAELCAACRSGSETWPERREAYQKKQEAKNG